MEFGLIRIDQKTWYSTLLNPTYVKKFLFAGILYFCCTLVVFWGSWSGTCHATGGEDVPLPQKDNAFGVTCPPGFCRIPEGYMMGLRDMPLGIHFMDDKRGWIIGNFGLGLRTTDGGRSWQKGAFSDEDSFKDVYFVEENGWIVGERGVILHTADGGQTWTRQTSTIDKSLLCVFFINSVKGFIVGGDGTMMKTEDAGATWERIDLEWDMLIPEELLELGVVSVNLYDVFFLTDSLGWIVGDAGTILRTLDGGRQWSVVHMGPVPPLFSVCFKNEGEGFAVGSHGYCLKTDDGGASWKKFDIGTENSLYKVDFHEDYGVAVGDLATLVKTENGGKTWVNVPSNIPPPYPWFVDVCILPNSPVRALTIGKSIIFNKDITSKQ